MQLHHEKHHQTYVNNLNAALVAYPQFNGMSIEDLLRHLNEVPEVIRTTVRNNGGGHANHQLFWKILRRNNGEGPSGALATAITDSFGSFEQMKVAFNEAGAKVFGSGWVYLVVDPKNHGMLKVHTTPNQDSVLLEGLPALLGNDLWEHAYYLKYQNRRPEYLNAWWNVVDWDVIVHRFEGVQAGKSQL